MRKPRKTNIFGTIAANTQRKATNKSTTALYELMWGEKPKRGRKKKNF